MTHWIKMGGRDLPVCFGFDVGYTYEKATGINYNLLVSKIDAEVASVRHAVNGGDLIGAATGMSVTNITDIVYWGAVFACRREGIEIDFEPADIAGWLFGSADTLKECVNALYESMPVLSDDDNMPAGSKKKQMARQKSTGKSYSRQRR